MSVPLDIFLLVITTLSKFMFTGSLSLSSSGCISRVFSMAVVSTFPQSAVSFITSLMFYLNFIFNFIALCSTVAFSPLFANSFFQLSVFIKQHVGLSLADNEAAQLPALQAVCKLNGKHSNQSLIDFERSNVIGH